MQVTINSDSKKIWDLLMAKIGNSFGVAAIMGNLMAESSLKTTCMTGKNKKNYESAGQYLELINSGVIKENEFANDGIAFGLVQWAYKTRKAGLYQYAWGKGIGTVETQIGYLLQELPKYKEAWRAVTEATNIDIPTRIVMLKYEKPANTSESAFEKRQYYATEYYTKYASDQEPAKPVNSTVKMVQTTADHVFVRNGPGVEYYKKDRVEKKGTQFPYIATAVNGWYAIKFNDTVYWISNDYSQII